MVSALIFDFFDVIRTDAYKAWLAKHQIPHEGPYFDISYQQDTGATTIEQSLEKLSELMGRLVTFEEIDGAATVDAAVVAIIAQLHTNYKLALLSNAPSKLIRQILAEHDLERHFDVIVVSSEVGMVKPNPEIFELTLEKLSVVPSGALFIDDNPRYVAAADKLGIETIQFTSAEQLQAELRRLHIHM